jgi:hypothetical protein
LSELDSSKLLSFCSSCTVWLISCIGSTVSSIGCHSKLKISSGLSVFELSGV